MAHIRTRNTNRKRKNGRPVKRYEVVWREQATDANGLPTGKLRTRQESYHTSEQAQARCAELNNAKHSPMGTTGLADARIAAARTFGEYAAAWLAAQNTRVQQGTLKQGVAAGYADIVRAYLLKRFGGKAIGAVTSLDCEAFLAELVAAGLAPNTIRNVWQVFRSMLRYAMRHKAIPANPADVVDTTQTGTAAERFEHKPLTGPQVALLATQVGERYPVYEPLVLFMAYPGLRAAEVQGLEVRDVVLTTTPSGAIKGSVRVQRTKGRMAGQWVTGTPKTARSRRTVPLPPWLAARLHDYLRDTHQASHDPHAPLWPRRLPGGARTKGQQAIAPLDYTQPCDTRNFAKRVLNPALEAVGLPVTRPARTLDDGTAQPATKGVRLHDLRHTAAALWLTAGVHFMQVSKWLGHASYVITMTVYADWMPDEEAANPPPEPQAPTTPATNVVALRPAQGE